METIQNYENIVLNLKKQIYLNQTNKFIQFKNQASLKKKFNLMFLNI
jgi:hypothetical protein